MRGWQDAAPGSAGRAATVVSDLVPASDKRSGRRCARSRRCSRACQQHSAPPWRRSQFPNAIARSATTGAIASATSRSRRLSRRGTSRAIAFASAGAAGRAIAMPRRQWPAADRPERVQRRHLDRAGRRFRRDRSVTRNERQVAGVRRPVRSRRRRSSRDVLLATTRCAAAGRSTSQECCKCDASLGSRG